MKAGSGMASGSRATPELVERAVHEALAAADLERAGEVILFLTREFARNPGPAVLAAARTAGTLGVTGCTAHGLITERGWLVDRPGAAALVIAASGFRPAPSAADLRLSFAGRGALPPAWKAGAPRAGLVDGEAVVWTHGRPAAEVCGEMTLPGIRARIARSTGLRLLGEPLTVDAAEGHDLHRLGGLAAAESLRRHLPPEARDPLPLHRVCLVRRPDAPAVPVLAAAPDSALTLVEPLTPGESVAWAIRQPLAAEQDMRAALAAAVDDAKPAEFALMFSCLGRGPLFYGDDDRDLLAFRQHCPGVPMLGAYGAGQIAPSEGGNRLFRNSVVTLLCESHDVQSLP
jgi:small ligand-binding sensory domain FIST